MPNQREDVPTSAQLRDRIDRGDAGDKVDFRDPAAAPLGTDAEAGGAPPSGTEVETALAAEVDSRESAPPAEHRRKVPATYKGAIPPVWLAVLALVVVAALFGAMLLT